MCVDYALIVKFGTSSSGWCIGMFTGVYCWPAGVQGAQGSNIINRTMVRYPVRGITIFNNGGGGGNTRLLARAA